MKPNRVWLTADELLEVPVGQRGKWLKEKIGLATAQADKLSKEVKELDGAALLEVLGKFAIGGANTKNAKNAMFSRAAAGQLVLQPGAERRRTSSHYTPRSLSAPIVRRTLEPLLACMGDEPPSHRILQLKVCDPAMGSGAFLVEACRFLGDQLVAAWTREGQIERVAADHGDPLVHARRTIAQRCLYGVDKNAAAVELGKLRCGSSHWQETYLSALLTMLFDTVIRSSVSTLTRFGRFTGSQRQDPERNSSCLQKRSAPHSTKPCHCGSRSKTWPSQTTHATRVNANASHGTRKTRSIA